MLGGVASAETIINCKLSEYESWNSNGTVDIYKNNELSLEDVMFKIDSKNKKLYNYVVEDFQLENHVKFTSTSISWSINDSLPGHLHNGSRSYSSINRNIGAYITETFHDKSSAFYKDLGMIKQKWTYNCESVKQKF